MSPRENPLVKIAMLEDNERLMARLYAAYAQHFPGNRAFWEGLAEEEKKHAGMLAALADEAREGSLHLETGRFEKAPIERFQADVKGLLERAGRDLLSEEQALESALAMEHDLVESAFFRVFEADSPEMKLILESLESSTKQHRKRIVEALEACRAS